MILGVVSDHVRQLCDARSAPRRPEVEHHDLALVGFGKLDRFAVRRRGVERNRLRAHGDVWRGLHLVHRFLRLHDLELPVRREVREFPRRAADVERLLDVEALAARVELPVGIGVDEEADTGRGGSLLPTEITRRQFIHEHGGKSLSAESDRALQRIVAVIENGIHQRRARRIALVETIQADAAILRAAGERNLHRGVAEVNDHLGPIAAGHLLVRPVRGRIVREIAVAVGIDEESRGFASWFIQDDEAGVGRFLRPDLQLAIKRCRQVGRRFLERVRFRGRKLQALRRVAAEFLGSVAAEPLQVDVLCCGGEDAGDGEQAENRRPPGELDVHGGEITPLRGNW